MIFTFYESKSTLNNSHFLKKECVTHIGFLNYQLILNFVFAENYKLKPLKEVEKFITKNKHLPDVPSESEVIENGISLGDMDAILLQKIEELTLYMIDLEKQNQQLSKEIKQLKKLNNYETINNNNIPIVCVSWLYVCARKEMLTFN